LGGISQFFTKQVEELGRVAQRFQAAINHLGALVLQSLQTVPFGQRHHFQNIVLVHGRNQTGTDCVMREPGAKDGKYKPQNVHSLVQCGRFQKFVNITPIQGKLQHPWRTKLGQIQARLVGLSEISRRGPHPKLAVLTDKQLMNVPCKVGTSEGSIAPQFCLWWSRKLCAWQQTFS
jgi:hypothetical protein